MATLGNRTPLLASEADPGNDRAVSRRRPAAFVACMVAFLIFGAVDHAQVGVFMQDFLNWCVAFGDAAPLLLCFSAVALNMLLLPTFPLMIGAGVVFTNMYGMQLGAAVGTLSVFSGLWLGSVAAFALGRTVFRDFARRELEQYEVLRVINGMIEKEGVKIVFLARMSPVLPAEVFNYACSLVEALSVPKYAAGCVGSIVPVSFWVTSTAHVTAIAHSGIAGAAGEDGALLIGINLVVLVVLTSALYGAYRRYRTEAEAHIREAMDASDVEASDSDRALVAVADECRTGREPVQDIVREVSGRLSKMPPVHPRFYSSPFRACTAVTPAAA